MHVSPTRLGLVVSACLACLAGGLLAGVATGGLRSEHVFRVETVTTTVRGQVLPAQTVTATVPQVVTSSETVTATAARVIEVAVHHRGAATTHGSTGARPVGPNQPPKQPKPAPKPPAPAPAPAPKPPPPPKQPKPPKPPKPAPKPRPPKPPAPK